MKSFLRTIVITLIISIFCSFNVFAISHYNPNDYTSVDIASKLLSESVKYSSVHETSKRRGNFFAGADLIIKNNGNGNVGVFAKAYMDVPVQEAYITVYVDRWDVEAERWKQVGYYDAEFYEKDYPNGLIEPSIDIEFKNMEKGYYYRARGVFAAVYNGDFEGFSPTTDGILIK